ncbi:MAG: hydroxymethylglutaryl-CoA lyase [Bacteroidetes bacterium]|nr:hydroxymethylglutaryl-CoA lyase [Bacteroidota bacterium]
MIQIVETSRDAMQGIMEFIPTASKVEYLNSLLKVGFDILEFGSFVSPRAVPQLKDSGEVVRKLNLQGNGTRLAALVGNVRGALEAVHYDEISYISYPHALSGKFLELNLNSSLDKSRAILAEILNMADKRDKKTIVYLSMAFGNPYEEEWSLDKLIRECYELDNMGVHRITLADTMGHSKPAQIREVYKILSDGFPLVKFGLHMHTQKDCWYDKLEAAYISGCKVFDGTVNGLGGCQFTGYEMIGNLSTACIQDFLEQNGISSKLNKKELKKARELSAELLESVHT